MITWMQRHKKWLVITIWISTIAFVGAGFVGWGSYNYGTKGGVVATVGDKEISVEEYSREYSNLYSQYSQIFGASFNKELAEQLRLKDIAFAQLMQKNLLMSYGSSLGLIVTDEEIAKELINYEEFKVDGKFNKNKYVAILQQNRMSPQDFENSLRNSIMFQKVQALFTIEPTANEIENISKLLFLEDDITYKILTLDDVDVTIDENELKKYFDENQNSYKSEVSYDLEIKEFALLSANATQEDIQNHFDKFKSDYKFDDGKIKSFEEAKEEIIKDLDENFTKKEALSLYLKLKKSEDNFDKKVTYSQNKIPFLAENVEKIKELKKDEILKPFFENNRFYIVKLVKTNPSVNLTFDEAKTKVIEDFKLSLKAKKLDELAQNSLKDFKGNDAVGVNRASAAKIKGLNEQEAIEFLGQLFASSTKDGIAKVGSKVVLYRVNSSKMASYDKAKDSFVLDEIKQVQNSDLLSNLLKKLENSIAIKTLMQTKE
ncbi:peptidylprolyl isomerase [Aliarcobacter trophiarum LMG 25534]|uniref:Peptidylprolyl isomerase n=1 Tax=Aliarcobacter trophiarum LMG 25534 TaxID=1032241 RepID=A0AAD0VLU4_9BACT|nr:peptidylprolyl isomerase [Aliarcobacter trophiarum]AXK48678.1 putative periplasmic folding chaperone [Aliarcobacter trophiarum LMG 25534]RXI27413.1 peptidylprolyl isomerase [Aliarcobacter trophiarum]RXJ91376.1 peptidylprolyl isomerase [Aliarcobacter trophiarum LMG 25534]